MMTGATVLRQDEGQLITPPAGCESLWVGWEEEGVVVEEEMTVVVVKGGGGANR